MRSSRLGLARSCARYGETADLSTPLRSGRDDKGRWSCQPQPSEFVFAFLAVIPEGNLLLGVVCSASRYEKQIPFGNDSKKGKDSGLEAA